MAEEETLYSDGTVSVTPARVVIGTTTYAVRNITSVKTTMTPPARGCATLVLAMGIIALLISLGVMGESISAGIVVLIIAASVIVGAIYWRRSCKPQYHVTIASASGEAHALASKDKAYIDTIVASINAAIVRCT